MISHNLLEHLFRWIRLFGFGFGFGLGLGALHRLPDKQRSAMQRQERGTADACVHSPLNHDFCAGCVSVHRKHLPLPTPADLAGTEADHTYTHSSCDGQRQ